MRLFSIVIVSLSFLLLFSSSSFSQEKKYALFLGNSYTFFNNLPDLVAELARSNGDTLFYDSNTPGGYLFRFHKSDAISLQKINSWDWDYVILQEQSQIPALPQSITQNDYSKPHARTLDSIIKANFECSKTMFFMTWGRKNGDQSFCGRYPPVCTYEGMQMELRKTYLEMAQENDASVAPVGMGWRLAMQRNANIELFDADASHPNINGSYLGACIFYASIFRKNSSGLTFHSLLDSTTATFLQGIADEIVFDSLDTWRIGAPDMTSNFSDSATGDYELSFETEAKNYLRLLWNINGTEDTSKNPSFVFDSAGTYTVSLKVIGDCDSSFTEKQVVVEELAVNPSGQIDLEEALKTIVYPNPFSQHLFISFETESQVKTIRIFDTKGATQFILQREEAGNAPIKLDLSSLSKGIYLLELQNTNGDKSHSKLIKQ